MKSVLTAGSTLVFDLPAAHRVRLRTTNGLERLNKEIKRRTRVAALFPNPESLLRLVTAILGEIDDGWATPAIYLRKHRTSPRIERVMR